MWGIGIGDLPLVFMTLLTLVFVEGLLSADNALVLAVMVRHLPKTKQKRALRYGIWGAFTFRIIAVILFSLLLKFAIIKVIGGLYLLYLAIAHFVSRSNSESSGLKRFGSGFWGTVISVEIADVAFSIDSILAAVAMAEGLPEHFDHKAIQAIIIIGGILGILAMRFVAGYFIILLDKYKGLEAGAYALVAWIGIKLTIGGIHDAGTLPFEMNEWVFWPGMLTIIIVSLIYKPKPGDPKIELETSAIIEEVAHMSRGESVPEIAVPVLPDNANRLK